MEELNLNEILNYMKNRILFIILIVLIVITLGIVYSLYIKVPQYRSTSTIVLATSGGISETLQTDVTLNQKLVDTYKEIVKSRSVLEESIDKLNLDMTYEILLEKVAVDSVTNTEVIKISVIDEDPEAATKLVTTITEVFNSEVAELYQIENIKVLDTASTPSDPYNINLLMEIAIYFVIGLGLALGILLVKFATDSTVKNVAEVELITGLPIIGSVPIFGEKRGIYE